MVESRSDSGEDTCFGVVWERVAEIKDKNVTVVPEHWVCPFAGLVIPETEDQQDAQKSAEEDNVPFCTLLAKEKAGKIGKDVIQNGDEFIGMSVAKKFEMAGRLEVFKGTVKEVTELQNRRLYAIVYEDGDCEDLNEQEFREACELFIALENNDEEMPDTDDGKEEYNSDVEISEYSCSDEEDSFLPPSKKRRTKKQLKEAESKPRRKKSKEVDGKETKAIDVEKILSMGSKTSVQTKTMALMTEDQNNSIIGTAEKSLLAQARKGLRDETMKVMHRRNIIIFSIGV